MIHIPEEENNYTYVLKCTDGTFYTGWTNDLAARLISHNSGKGSKYTRTRCPVELVYYEISPTKEEAMSREWHIKQLSRKQKERLVGMCEIPTTVYIADASALDDKELFDKLYEKASSDRKKKADAMRRKADKNLSLAAETLLDIALSENKIDIKKLVFGNGKNGKPEIISRNNLYFNLSHSGDMVMCIISDVPVGCDVERTEKPVKNIAGHFFSPAENEFLGKISDETAKKDMFFRIWTLKESFIKNIGTGLAYPLKNFSIIPGKDEIILEQTYDENSYCLREFEFDQNYKYSVCVFGNEKRKINMHYIELEGLNV